MYIHWADLFDLRLFAGLHLLGDRQGAGDHRAGAADRGQRWDVPDRNDTGLFPVDPSAVAVHLLHRCHAGDLLWHLRAGAGEGSCDDGAVADPLGDARHPLRADPATVRGIL